jgi:hypothetical protein
MFKDEENIALRNLQIFTKFVNFVLICIFLRVIQIHTAKFANFAGLCFPHFTTFRNQTLQFY